MLKSTCRGSAFQRRARGRGRRTELSCRDKSFLILYALPTDDGNEYHVFILTPLRAPTPGFLFYITAVCVWLKAASEVARGGPQPEGAAQSSVLAPPRALWCLCATVCLIRSHGSRQVQSLLQQLREQHPSAVHRWPFDPVASEPLRQFITHIGSFKENHPAEGQWIISFILNVLSVPDTSSELPCV